MEGLESQSDLPLLKAKIGTKVDNHKSILEISPTQKLM